MAKTSVQYILAIDQGTTSSKVLVMDHELNPVAEKAIPFEQHFPKPGWVEHDLEQIWQSVVAGIVEVTKEIDANAITAIGITNQRETICFWDKKTTLPLANAIVWQDRRTSARCDELRKQGFEKKVQDKTGLLLDPYFSSTKIEWALQNNPKLKKASETGTLAIGTIDSFLVARLTSGDAHVTEPSNASRTMLFDIHKCAWDLELAETFGVSLSSLPKVLPSFSEFGRTRNVKGLPDGIVISGVLGDQQSALMGQACLVEGQAKCTYGTGAFMLMNTGHRPRKSNHRLLTTIAWTDQKGVTTYALEGSAFMAGATIQWLRDGLRMISNSKEMEPLAGEVESTDGVMFVPSFTGMGAPYWDPSARAIISGLSRGSTRAHIARAALEGIALQNADILQAMEKDLGKELTVLKVDGGACKNDLLMQMQSDFIGRDLKRPKFTETTSLGAIFAAGIGSGVWSSLSDVEKVWMLDRDFKPAMTSDARAEKLKDWSKAVERARL
jgi:glycerol kinase